MDPDYRIWYNRRHKTDGTPIMIEDCKTGIVFHTDSFELDNVKLKIKFQNVPSHLKKYGGSTIMEAYVI